MCISCGNAGEPDSWGKYAFAVCYGMLLRFCGFLLTPTRKAMLSGLEGTVVDIGCGDGCNLPLYKKAAKVFAFDPNSHLLSKAAKTSAAINAKEDGKTVVFLAGLGDEAVSARIPAGSADHVVLCLVLCSIPNPAVAVDQAVAMLKVGGTMVVLEHIAHRNASSVAFKVQRWVNGWWRRMADGCELTRRTDELLMQHGSLEVIDGPHYRGMGNFNLLPLVRMKLRRVA